MSNHLTCFKCGRNVDNSICGFDGGQHETRPHSIFEFKFVMPLTPAQESAWHNELDRLNAANDGSNPMYYEDEIVPKIKEMFFVFLNESPTGLYDAETKLLDDNLEEKAARN